MTLSTSMAFKAAIKAARLAMCLAEEWLFRLYLLMLRTSITTCTFFTAAAAADDDDDGGDDDGGDDDDDDDDGGDDVSFSFSASTVR